MSIMLQRYLVRNVFAVPIHTKHGIVVHYFSRVSFLHVPQKVPISGLKRFYKPQEVPFKPSKPSQTKTDLVNEKPQQAPSTIKTVPPQNQERELSDGSITMGAAAPSPRRLPIPMFCVREKIKESLKLKA